MAEFAANNAESSTTQMTPFFANLGYYPQMSFDPPGPKESQTTPDIADRMAQIVETLREQITLAQHRQESFADEHRTPALAYKPND